MGETSTFHKCLSSLVLLLALSATTFKGLTKSGGSHFNLDTSLIFYVVTLLANVYINLHADAHANVDDVKD